MTPTVLLYNLESEKGRKIKGLCLLLKLRARSVDQKDFSRSLNQVLGIDAEDPPVQEEEAFGDEMMVMAGLSAQQMNGLLQGFRKKKIPPVELKAVLTETNGAWNAYQLVKELRAERAAMLQGGQAHSGGNP